EQVPTAGPLVVVSNHPFGAIDALILLELIGSVRTDVRLLANRAFCLMPALRSFVWPVDSDRKGASVAANCRATKELLRWIERGGCAIIFPSGEVSRATWSQWQIMDRPWPSQLGRLIRRARCAVQPVYFRGRNGPLFQLLGLIHPFLRTAMLPR